MEIKHLERFLTVFECGSLSAAAKKLGLSQQALSSSIAKLEDEIELTLFDRQPGGTTKPTQYGRALVRHARSQIASIGRATEELHAIRDAKTGTVTIGIGESFVGDITASAIARLHSMRPEIRINLIEDYSEKLLERLLDGELDFMAGDIGGLYSGTNLNQDLCFTASDVICARMGHPLAGKANLSLKDLQGYTWIAPYSRPSDLNTITEAFIAEKLEPPKNVIGSDAIMVGMKLLQSTDFLIMTSPGLIDKQSAINESTLAILDIQKPTVLRHAYLIYKNHQPLSPIASLLMKEIQDACEAFGK